MANFRLFSGRSTVDFDTFFKKIADHLEEKKVIDKMQAHHVDYDSKEEEVSCFFCPYSTNASVGQ